MSYIVGRTLFRTLHILLCVFVYTNHMNKKSNITLGIIIDTDLKIPPKTGVDYRLYYLSRQLVKEGVNVKLFICNRGVENEEDLKKLYSQSNIEIHIVPHSVFYDLLQMELVIKNAHIDVLQFEDPVYVLRFSQISTNLKIPVCLEMHDVEATLAEKLKLGEEKINRSKEIIDKACNLAQKIVFMTNTDFDQLKEITRANVDKFTHVPNPIDTREFPYQGASPSSKKIIFVGNMFYWPNLNAARFIVEKLYPAIHKIDKDVSFVLTGMIPEEIREISRDKIGIHITGSVDDLNAVLENASVAVCPVQEGSGMKVKILNYSAAGLPIVATDIGASGYESIPSLIIENDLNKYAQIIASLLNDPRRIKALGKNNRKFVKENFDIRPLAKKMKGVYEDLIKKGDHIIGGPNEEYRSKLPFPLWTNESRVKKQENKTYYVLKNEKVIYKEAFPKIFVIEGFWKTGKSSLIRDLSSKYHLTLIVEPNHLDHGIETEISNWYLDQHMTRLNRAKDLLGSGFNVVMERSAISNIAFHYAKNNTLPSSAEKILSDTFKIENIEILFLISPKKYQIKRALLNIKDKNVIDAINNIDGFYDRYCDFYIELLPKLTKARISIIKAKSEADLLSNGRDLFNKKSVLIQAK